jgi:hypothetical protein
MRPKQWRDGTLTRPVAGERGVWIVYTDLRGDPDPGEDRSPIRVGQVDIYYGAQDSGGGTHPNVYLLRDGRRVNHEAVKGEYRTRDEATGRQAELREMRRDGILV